MVAWLVRYMSVPAFVCLESCEPPQGIECSAPKDKGAVVAGAQTLAVLAFL